MKHSYNSYGLYNISNLHTFIIRTKVNMKDKVDINILSKAVNKATRRYPYLMVKVQFDNDGGFDFIPNDNDISVLHTSKKNPDLGSKKVGYHLLYVDCEDKTIYFNNSHAIAGGKGLTPWVMTCLYEYVTEKYGVVLNAPSILKPESELLPGETDEPTFELTEGAEQFPLDEFMDGRSMIKDYLYGFFNPFLSAKQYYEFVFNQSDIMKIAKETNNSVLTLFNVLMFKAMMKVYPDSEKLVAESVHNPAYDLGLPNTYVNLLGFLFFSFTQEMNNWDLKQLGIFTREKMKQQLDPKYSKYSIKRTMEFFNEIDKISGTKEKTEYASKNNVSMGNHDISCSYFVSYTGYLDWGEVADYIDSYFYVVDGHNVLELSAIKDKIFCCFIQLLKTKKYLNAFKEVLDENKISYTIKGPYKKNLMGHKF